MIPSFVSLHPILLTLLQTQVEPADDFMSHQKKPLKSKGIGHTKTGSVKAGRLIQAPSLQQ